VRILRYEPPETLNQRLKSKYRAALFDFAYLLAIALNGEFLTGPDIALRSRELRQVRGALTGLKRNLENTKTKLAKYDSFQELLFHIGRCLRRVREEAYLIHRQRGRIVEEKTKLVLLWTQLLVRKWEKPLKEPAEVSFRGGAFQILKKTVESIDWNDYFTLLGFFYDRLKDCSYSFYIKPKPDRQKEKDYAKSLLAKNYAAYERRANGAILEYELAQGYFRNNRSLPRKVGPPRGPKREVYPLVKICFTKDAVETTELRERGSTLTRKVKFLDKRKIPCKPEEKREDIQHPTVAFPNGDQIIIEDYAPPFFPSSLEQDELVEDLRAKILGKPLSSTKEKEY